MPYHEEDLDKYNVDYKTKQDLEEKKKALAMKYESNYREKKERESVNKRIRAAGMAALKSKDNFKRAFGVEPMKKEDVNNNHHVQEIKELML